MKLHLLIVIGILRGCAVPATEGAAAGEVGGGAGGMRGAVPGARVVTPMIRCFVTQRFPAHSRSHLFGGCWTS